MAKLYNLARMTTATTGTGTITLGSAVSGYLSFATSGVQNGEIVTYGIRDGANSEVGRGVYTSSGTTLTRSVLKSTNSDSAINLSGSAEVFVTAAAEDIIVVPSGTKTTFQQTNAPTGWTKDTTNNNKALRLINGTVGTGGTNTFSTVFGKTATDTHALTISEMPAHTHSYVGGSYAAVYYGSSVWTTDTGAGSTSNAGSGTAHSHNIDLRVYYVDVIVASRDA